ncbi:MAG: hypothetical protein HY326_14160 [Chloroflexi bacterium]|nr:hypothetical protein [Chloroflexota bacterium]
MLRTIETIVTVTPDGKILVRDTADLPPGEHRAVLVIAETVDSSQEVLEEPKVSLHTFPWNNWPVDATFRREDIYGDEGR